jgi:hypothetical protein
MTRAVPVQPPSAGARRLGSRRAGAPGAGGGLFGCKTSMIHTPSVRFLKSSRQTKLLQLVVTGLVLVLSAGAQAATSGTAPVAPRVVFYQTGLPERYCERVSPGKPDPAAVAEIRARLPEFRRAWEENGAPLLAAVVRVTGHPFHFSETLAVLHACPDMENWSAPLVIAAARYTRAFGGAESGPVQKAIASGQPIPKLPPQSMDTFIYVVWHELMHRYVQELQDDLPGGSTPLQRKYWSEGEVVRGHIHLYAAEKVIWHQLGRDSEYVERAVQAKASGYKGHYRAIEIVDAEGAETILSELRASANQR